MEETSEGFTSSAPRRFASMADIEREPGFVPDNPIDATNYRRLVGYYRFEEEVACCYRKGRVLCREGHRFGFVALLSDQTITLVGNSCAKTRFGAGTQFEIDRRTFENRRTLHDRFGRLAGFVEKQDDLRTMLASEKAALHALKGRFGALCEALGRRLVDRLRDMARTGQNNVSIKGVTAIHYVDDDGVRRTEHRKAYHRIGNVPGLEIFRHDVFDNILQGIKAMSASLDEAVAMTVSKKKVRDLAVARLVTVLGDSARITNALARLTTAFEQFDSCDVVPLCYLVSTTGDRMRVAQRALQRDGQGNGESHARAFLSAIDERHRGALGAQRLEY
jgi:hypothetical protein